MLEDPLFLIAANLFAAVLVRLLKPHLLTAVLLVVVLIGSTGYLGTHHGSQVVRVAYRGRDAVLNWCGKPSSWPPEKHRTYPDLALTDHRGKPVQLTDFKGRVILLEMVAIPCQACVAFSGGHEFGPFQDIPPQPDLASIETYAAQFGSIKLDDERIVRVHLLLFNHALQSPTLDEASDWAKHFQVERSGNQVVLVGGANLATAASRALIPGFQLIDKHFVLRRDSTGESPDDDLYGDLLPQIRELVDEE